MEDGSFLVTDTYNKVIWRVADGVSVVYAGSDTVADPYKGAVRKIAPEGNVTTFVRGFTEPMGLCWADGTLYVAETGANRIVKVANGQATVVAGNGEEGLVDGPAAQAAFSNPQGIAVGEDGTVYVSGTVNGAVRPILFASASHFLTAKHMSYSSLSYRHSTTLY